MGGCMELGPIRIYEVIFGEFHDRGSLHDYFLSEVLGCMFLKLSGGVN